MSGQKLSGEKLSWDDIKAFLAVAAHGSMNRAAASLGESQATIGRRMARLEQCLGVVLLDRGVNAVKLLPASLDLLRVIAPMSEAAQEIDAAMRPYRPSFGGPLRITATNTMSLFLSQYMQQLSQLVAPNEIVLLPTRRPLDIAAGEADIALRMRSPAKDNDLLVRKVGLVVFGVYGLRNRPNLPMIMPSGDNAVSKQRSCAEIILNYRERGPQIDELHLRIQAIKAGVGAGLLPCWMGDKDPDLVKLHSDISEIVSDEMYLIRSAKSRDNAHVSKLCDALSQLLRQNRHALRGQLR